MNRRGFLRSMLAAPVAALPIPALAAPSFALFETPDPIELFRASEIGRQYAAALARSLMETKATIAANILNKAFQPGAYLNA